MRYEERNCWDCPSFFLDVGSDYEGTCALTDEQVYDPMELPRDCPRRFPAINAGLNGRAQ